MDIIIPLLIVSVLIGIPTWLIVHTVNKADKSTIIYSPEEVTRRLRKGFYLSFWGMDLLFGAIPSFVLIFCDLPTVFQFIVPAVAFIVGFIMFFIGRIQVGLMTRYINFCNRERTEFEEWVLQAMLGIEEAGVAIENPFGFDPNALPLESICQRIASNIAEAAHEPH